MGKVVTYVVTPVGGLWKVGMSGNSHPDSVHPDKQAAIARAEQLARAHQLGQVIVRTGQGAVETAYFLGARP